MVHRHKGCKHLLGSLSAYLDGELEAQLCAELERHLESCENCQVVVDTLRRTVSLYKVTSTETTMPDDVRQRLYHRLELDDFLKH